MYRIVKKEYFSPNHLLHSHRYDPSIVPKEYEQGITIIAVVKSNFVIEDLASRISTLRQSGNWNERLRLESKLEIASIPLTWEMNILPGRSNHHVGDDINPKQYGKERAA